MTTPLRPGGSPSTPAITLSGSLSSRTAASADATLSMGGSLFSPGEDPTVRLSLAPRVTFKFIQDPTTKQYFLVYITESEGSDTRVVGTGPERFKQIAELAVASFKQIETRATGEDKRVLQNAKVMRFRGVDSVEVDVSEEFAPRNPSRVFRFGATSATTSFSGDFRRESGRLLKSLEGADKEYFIANPQFFVQTDAELHSIQRGVIESISEPSSPDFTPFSSKALLEGHIRTIPKPKNIEGRDPLIQVSDPVTVGELGGALDRTVTSLTDPTNAVPKRSFAIPIRIDDTHVVGLFIDGPSSRVFFFDPLGRALSEYPDIVHQLESHQEPIIGSKMNPFNWKKQFVSIPLLRPMEERSTKPYQCISAFFTTMIDGYKSRSLQEKPPLFSDMLYAKYEEFIKNGAIRSQRIAILRKLAGEGG